MNQDNNSAIQQVENSAISALAAASKTPFKTAFLLTLGIGAAHLVMFLGTITFLVALVVGCVKVLS